MAEKNLSTIGGKSLEDLMRTNDFGAGYWSARDLQPLLGCSQWRRFIQAIERAMASCEQSGNTPAHHFAGAGKMIELGSGSQRNVEDYQLSRFACYLIAMNGDPRKQEIAQAQKYFTVQTRRQELSEQLAADVERLELRKQTAEEFKALSGAAQQAGVQNRMFGVFHDAGYKGLYGGLGNEDIKVRKGRPHVSDMTAEYRIAGQAQKKINPPEIVLDFFAGSGTTAQAVIEQNNEDRGFRAFKLSSSNFKIWDADRAATESAQLSEQLHLYANNLAESRTQQGVLYELILKSGLPLTAKVETQTVAGKTVHSIADGNLLICLENPVTQELLRGMMALGPLQILCVDAAFHGNDPLKTNAVLEAKSHGIAFRTV